MATSVEIVVIENRFGTISRRMQAGIAEAKARAAITIMNAADPLTRVDTGALRANKTSEIDDSGVTVNWHQNYAAYQNNGTVYMTGTHFAEAGLDAARGPFLDAIARVVEG